MQVWVGTSGYVYPDWVGGFYPPGTSSRGMLSYYTRHFPLVELNYTFYRLPGPDDLAKLAARTPEGFQFIVKLHQSLSHEQDLSEAASFGAAVAPLQEQGRLLGLLAQLPQRFHYGPESLDHLGALADRFADHPLAVEFRHQSWARPEVVEWLARRGLHLVSVDVPGIPSLFPAGLVQSGRLIYVRFHSRRASAWHAGDKERYDYLYTEEELQSWVDALARRADRADQALVLFNNCHGSQAAINALQFRALLSARRGDLGDLTLVEPPAPPEPDEKQGELFDI